VLVVPVTVGVMVVDFPAASEADVGLTEMDIGATGTNATVALALFVESAALVAFTVIVCAEEIVAGAV
jgi:hypothetical protein